VVLEDLTGWLFQWVGQQEVRIWIFIAVCVIAVLMWAVASLMELGTEFGISALAGLLVSANSGFFLGFVVFSVLFLALFVVLGSVVGGYALAADFAISTLAGWLVLTQLGPLFGLLAFTAAFLGIGALIGRAERVRPAEPSNSAVS